MLDWLELNRANSSGSHDLALQTQEQVLGCRTSHALLKLTLASVGLPGPLHEELQGWLANVAAH